MVLPAHSVVLKPLKAISLDAGFLKGAPALSDQRLAMKWVQDHISGDSHVLAHVVCQLQLCVNLSCAYCSPSSCDAVLCGGFGGDPKRTTIAGQSAGL